MEPVALIIAAVVAGATAGAKDVIKSAVKDTYELFRARLKKKVGRNEDVQHALADVEKKPESEARQAVLKEELSETGADKDEELIRLAQQLLAQFDQKGAQSGKYNITISNGKGIVIGDNAKVTQHFD